MIKFTSKTANKNELKEAIWEELVKCAMNAILPSWRIEEFDRNECLSNPDKHCEFVIRYLDEYAGSELKINDDGVVLYDGLMVDDAEYIGNYDLEGLANAIKNRFPDVIVQGKGYIDYHYSAENYRIYTKGSKIVYKSTC